MNSPDQIFENLQNWDQNAVRKARIMVVGAGALGNEVLKNLALLNVGGIVIVDFDQVEFSNLSRSVLFRQKDATEKRYKAHVAAERLLEINPELSIQTLVGDVVTDLSIGLIQKMDVVIGCVDNRLARLFLNRLCWRAGIPWVDGGILNLSGQVSTYIPAESCYECSLGTAAWKEIRQRQACTDMARRYALQGQAPTTPIAASIAGALQVQEALRIVMQKGEGSLSGKMLNFEGGQNHFAIYEMAALKADCQSHYRYDPLLEAEELSADSTLGETIEWLKAKQNIASPIIYLDHSIATKIAGLSTGKHLDVILPMHQFSDRLAREFGTEENELYGIPAAGFSEQLTENSGYEALPLWRFGIPPGHVLRIGRGEGRKFLSLAGDLSRFSLAKGIDHLPNPWHDISAAQLLTKQATTTKP